MLEIPVRLSFDKEVTVNNVLGGLLQHVVTVPAGDGHEGNSLGVVADLLDEVGGLLDDFVETILRPLRANRGQRRGRSITKVDHKPWWCPSC